MIIIIIVTASFLSVSDGHFRSESYVKLIMGRQNEMENRPSFILTSSSRTLFRSAIRKFYYNEVYKEDDTSITIHNWSKEVRLLFDLINSK